MENDAKGALSLVAGLLFFCLFFFNVLPKETRRLYIAKTSDPIKEYRIVQCEKEKATRSSVYYVRISWQNYLWWAEIPAEAYEKYDENRKNNASSLYDLNYYYDEKNGEIFCYELTWDFWSPIIFFSILFIPVILIGILAVSCENDRSKLKEEEGVQK